MSRDEEFEDVTRSWVSQHPGASILDVDTVLFPTGHHVDLRELRETFDGTTDVETAVTEYLDTLWDHAHAAAPGTRSDTFAGILVDLLTEEGFPAQRFPGEVHYHKDGNWEAIDVTALLGLIEQIPDDHLGLVARRIVDVATGKVSDTTLGEDDGEEGGGDFPSTWEETLPLLHTVLLPITHDGAGEAALAQVTPHTYECLTILIDGEPVLLPREVTAEMPLTSRELLAHGRRNSKAAAGDVSTSQVIKGAPVIVIDCPGPFVTGFLDDLANLPGASGDGIVFTLPTSSDLAATPVAPTLTRVVLRELDEAGRILHEQGTNPLHPGVLWFKDGAVVDVTLDEDGEVVGPEALRSILDQWT